MKKREMPSLLVYGLACLLSAGCTKPNPMARSSNPEMHPLALLQVDKQIDVFDAGMEKENVIPTSADQRPTWVVSGRIKNHTRWFVESVWVEVHILDKQTGSELDSTIIKMDHLRVPPNDGVVAFSQAVRILPPARPWTWTYNVISAATEPLHGDIGEESQ
ncbi:MAG: hypothetical protein HIU91_16235 [Acidobacteria bacterium]|nr:hypothetical protein [Acidobacteriota bacterium]